MKSSNILKVAEVFKSILPMAERDEQLNMAIGFVNNVDYACGSIHCAAGWFAIGTKLHLTGWVNHGDGKREMAKMLGFDDDSELKYWASENQEIWGNEYPLLMFSKAIAYYHPTKRPLGAQNLRHIYDHLMEVYERAKATEQPSRIDITGSLAILPVEERLDEKIVEPINV